jgi:hypothetical protein
MGLGLAVVVLGPALAPGSVFAFDLTLPPDLPVPRGVWGLGPELPRRVPLLAIPAWLTPIAPSWLTGKAIMVAAITLAFVGAFRLVRDRSTVAAIGCGALFALSPFLLTRLAAGHLPIVVAMALLPWCYRRLLRPADDLPATLLACGALAGTGNYGGLLALAIVGAGLVNQRGRRAGWVLGSYAIAQLPWLVPALFVLNEGGELNDAHAFATTASGPVGWASVLGGGGFWNTDLQIGWSPVVMAILGIGLLALAVLGHRDLPDAWRRPAVVLAGLGVVVTLASAFDSDANPFFVLTRNPIGANLRDSQRLLPLFVIWMAPAAALGARRLARSLPRASSSSSGGTGSPAPGRLLSEAIALSPAMVAVGLALPGLLGVGGHLQTTAIPFDWQQVRAQVTAAPGTVVSLPWHEYATFDPGPGAAGSQTIFDPWPSYLGGDVIICSDPERQTACGSAESIGERADEREAAITPLVADARAGKPIGDEMARLGVRWVVLAHVADWRGLQSLVADPGLHREVVGPNVDLYRVRSWPGEVVDDNGHPVGIDRRVEPWAQVDPSGPAEWNHAASSGWRRGTEAVAETADGRLQLPAGDGPVWYWPALVVLVADVVWLAAMGAGVVSTRRRRRRPEARPPRPARRHPPR